MDLREAGVREERAALVGAPDRGRVAARGVGRQVERVAVAAGGQNHRVRGVPADGAGDQVARDDAPGAALVHHQVEHLGAREHLHVAEADLPRQRLIGAEQQLLPGLAAGIEGARHLGAAEGAVGEHAAVLARERHALRHALVDDLHGELGQAIDVRLARPEVAALHRVVEQPIDAVAVVLVVLGGVDAALRGDRMRPPGRILVTEALHLVAELGERRGRRGSGQSRADDDDGETALVGRIHQLHVEPGALPLGLDRAGGNSGIEHHDYLTTPVSTAIGKETLPRVITMANSVANRRRHGFHAG